ncbi:MAG: beta-lactamase class A-like protein beta-lactamase [Candidatus Adlerbacteria bacterium]|nr:beta-lactamase class A-like protein beta-lactamase [Candidatus Adlerbacteria bacterium]
MKRIGLLTQIAFWAAMLCAGCALGWFAHASMSPSPTDIRGATLYQSNAPYQYIDPLLACDVGTESAFPELRPLTDTISGIINQKKQAGLIDNASVYVRTLRGARWIQVNAAAKYAPASLLKVFVMMAYFKETDDTDNVAFLDKRIAFEGSVNTNDDTPGEVIPHLQAGKYYPVRDIIKQMIVYSDNEALNTLVDNFDSKTLADFEQIFTDLNIPSPVKVQESQLDFMGVQDYSMIFRVLFGATYLSRQYSEEALALLAQAHYKGALVAGLPPDIAVAHKFGVSQEVTTMPAGVVNELHDCGIVYYPGHPYLMCVMTQGDNYADLQQTIADISRASYNWLDQYWNTHPAATPALKP